MAGSCCELTYPGSTLYLVNHVAHTSAASSDRPSTVVVEGVGSSVQLEVVVVVVGGVGNRGKS